MSRGGAGEGRAADWTELRRRLDVLGRSLAEVSEPSPEGERAILESRARRLAGRPADASAETRLQLLAFSLGTDTYAVEANRVLGVFRLLDVAPLPGAERRIAGLTVWRGSLLTVVDLRRVLGLASEGLDDRAWIIAIGDEQRRCGLLAGMLRDVVQLPSGAIREPAEQLAVDRRFVRGLTSDAVVVLDADALLTAEP